MKEVLVDFDNHELCSIFLDRGFGRESNNAYEGAEKVQKYLNRAQSKASHVTQASTADHFGQLESKPHSCASALSCSQKKQKPAQLHVPTSKIR